MSLAYGTVMYVWMMEHADGETSFSWHLTIPGKMKTVLGACPHYNFGFWGLITALVAYCVPDWRDMQVRPAATSLLLS